MRSKGCAVQNQGITLKKECSKKVHVCLLRYSQLAEVSHDEAKMTAEMRETSASRETPI